MHTSEVFLSCSLSIFSHLDGIVAHTSEVFPSYSLSIFSHLDGIAAHREVAFASLLTSGPCVLLLGLQGAADGSSLLWAKVERHVLCALVGIASLLLLLLIVHCQDASNGLSHNLNLCKLRSSTSG